MKVDTSEESTLTVNKQSMSVRSVAFLSTFDDDETKDHIKIHFLAILNSYSYSVLNL